MTTEAKATLAGLMMASSPRERSGNRLCRYACAYRPGGGREMQSSQGN